MDSQGIKIKLQSVIVAEQDVLRLQSQLEHLQHLEQAINESQSYSDLKAEQLAKINKHKQPYRAAQRIIDSLLISKHGQHDPEKTRAWKTILAERYLHGKGWSEIARLINYSERQVQRLHGTALEAAAKAAQRKKKI